MILSADQQDYILTYINSSRQAVNYRLLQLRHFGCHPRVAERLHYARAMLEGIINIQGEAVWSTTPGGRQGNYPHGITCMALLDSTSVIAYVPLVFIDLGVYYQGYNFKTNTTDCSGFESKPTSAHAGGSRRYPSSPGDPAIVVSRRPPCLSCNMLVPPQEGACFVLLAQKEENRPGCCARGPT